MLWYSLETFVRITVPTLQKSLWYRPWKHYCRNLILTTDVFQLYKVCSWINLVKIQVCYMYIFLDRLVWNVKLIFLLFNALRDLNHINTYHVMTLLLDLNLIVFKMRFWTLLLHHKLATSSSLRLIIFTRILDVLVEYFVVLCFCLIDFQDIINY